ncbi:MAG TPA: coproporphyrinogen dehydrogenase HemZ [Clostridiales bacterium]|nr:coproporphyrinogen dehydrogenase HemZ [Clostridiales bacterium]
MKSLQLSLKCILLPFLNDVLEIFKAYKPYIEIVEDASDIFFIETYENSSSYGYKLIFKTYNDIFNLKKSTDILDDKRKFKKKLKTTIYNILKNETKIELPYGSLTGVRPTIVAKRASDLNNINFYLTTEYGVSSHRAKLLEEIIINQKNIYELNQKNICLYINIPFCPSRCSYCSFLSNEISKVRQFIDIYVDILEKQIDEFLEIYVKNKLILKSIYIGGGTPSCIDLNLIEKIISKISGFNCEFTFEAGRAETIKTELLDLLEKNNVNRISINPQTFSKETLLKINRNTSIEQIYEAFNLAKKYNFSINSDLIIGLNYERENEIFNSIKELVKISPDNITIHSLSIKKGSTIANKGQEKAIIGLGDFMIDCYNYLKLNNYFPYYLYRQKNTLDNLENIGFSKKGKECIYNVLNMEDICSIYAIGAGAISKFVNLENNSIERKSYPKDIKQFLKLFDKI